MILSLITPLLGNNSHVKFPDKDLINVHCVVFPLCCGGKKKKRKENHLAMKVS